MTLPFRPRWYFFIALVSITFIGPLSIHLFIPAMPAVKEAFGVSTGMAQLTLSLGMLSMRSSRSPMAACPIASDASVYC